MLCDRTMNVKIKGEGYRTVVGESSCRPKTVTGVWGRDMGIEDGTITYTGGRS